MFYGEVGLTMIDYKILQIIPAPSGMTAEYRYVDEDGKRLDETYTLPVCCLALIEYSNGEQDVMPVCFYDNSDTTIGDYLKGVSYTPPRKNEYAAVGP